MTIGISRNHKFGLTLKYLEVMRMIIQSVDKINESNLYITTVHKNL